MTRSRHLFAALASLSAAALLLTACNTTDTTGAPSQVASTAGTSDAIAPAQTSLDLPAASTLSAGTRSTAEKIGHLQTVGRHERVREATRLGLSEAHLFAADVGKNVIRLKDGRETALEILNRRLHELGRLRASARNDDVSLSVIGTPRPPRLIPATEEREARTFPGYFGPPIDLRPDFSNWQFTFAQITFTRDGQVQRSLTFFDNQGRAVQRLIIDTLDGIPAFEQIIQDFRAETQSSEIVLTPEEPADPIRPDAQVDVPSLIAAWDAITDVHQFSTAVLAKHDVTRLQALRLAGPERAQRLDSPKALDALLSAAAHEKLEIMAFVSNSANTQIFTGKIEAPTKARGGWLRVGDEHGASLSINEAGIDQIWLVKKPSSIGILSTVEVYNAKGEVIVQFYSKREPRKPESDTWRALLAKLPKA